MCCPPLAAWELHKAIPESKLYYTTAGHSTTDPENLKKLTEVCDEYAKLEI